MSLAETEVHEQQKWLQYEETWGHLYPKPGDHPGYMVVAHSDYSSQGVVVVHEEFEGVESSPWFYEWMTGFAFESMVGRDRRVTKYHNVVKWGIFDGDRLLFSNSDKKEFWRREEAETHLREVRERLADSVSLSKVQWERAGERKTGIWEFRGVLRVRPSGKVRFVGKWTKMSLYPGRIPATKPRGHWGVWPYSQKKAIPEMRESDDDYFLRNRDAVVRFLDTMNKRRHGRDGMEPTEKTMAKTKEQRAARALQERTGWSYSECLRLVREKSPEDLEQLVVARGVKA